MQPSPRAETRRPLRPSSRNCICISCLGISADLDARDCTQIVEFVQRVSAGLNRRSCRNHAGFGVPQGGNSAHARVNAIQAVTVESDGEKILEIEHYHTIKGIERHAHKESPLLALAGKIPEDNEDSSHETVDDQIK